MGALLKGVQSVLIALGIIAVIGTGVIVYYNTVKPPEEETAAAIETETESETEQNNDTQPADTGGETESSDITDPTSIPVSDNEIGRAHV